ncbi:MAG: hypothetical protein ACRDQ7_13340, partial [Haloechinothrix sp.]
RPNSAAPRTRSHPGTNRRAGAISTRASRARSASQISGSRSANVAAVMPSGSRTGARDSPRA